MGAARVAFGDQVQVGPIVDAPATRKFGSPRSSRPHLEPGARRMVLCPPALLLALFAQSRHPRAAAQQSPPPPPPPPPPLIPLESGTPLCTREALTNLPVDARPVFTAFGGSNTQGANALSLNSRNGNTEYGPHVPSFANLLGRALGRGFATHMHADGGSGPSLAGACTSRFIPPETRVGTVEFLPNLGYIKEDRAELAAVKMLLQARGHKKTHGAAASLIIAPCYSALS